jgi:hypothetical protein
MADHQNEIKVQTITKLYPIQRPDHPSGHSGILSD